MKCFWSLFFVLFLSSTELTAQVVTQWQVTCRIDKQDTICVDINDQHAFDFKIWNFDFTQFEEEVSAYLPLKDMKISFSDYTGLSRTKHKWWFEGFERRLSDTLFYQYNGYRLIVEFDDDEFWFRKL